MYSTKLSVSIHILSVIALSDIQPITSEYIASSINTNPALVRRLMARLKKAKLIQTSTKLGITGLAREAKDITLLDVFLAVEDSTQLFGIHSNTNLQCPVGANIEKTLKHVYNKIQIATEKELSMITLDKITKEFIINEGGLKE